MLTLVPILSLLLTAALIGLLRIIRPKFAYHWLIAAFGALTAWIAIWVMRDYDITEARAREIRVELESRRGTSLFGGSALEESAVSEARVP